MPGLNFEDYAPIAPATPLRTDVALFAGFVLRRNSRLPAAVQQWLNEQGWTAPPYGRPVDELLDLPVPIESLTAFEILFDWRRRSAANDDGATYLGAAVRSFFAQGGRRCYVVRAGDPWPLETPRATRLEQIARLIPGYPVSFSATAADRNSWRGAGHLYGLPDVSFICLPDLADAVATDRVRISIPVLPARDEGFVECSENVLEEAADASVRGIRAPRCDDEGYGHWAKALALLASAIRGDARPGTAARETQLIAAVPLPAAAIGFTRAPSTAFVQLAYPWAKTPGSADLPEMIESPDGVLTGVLARNALIQGSFRSAANRHLADVYDVFPVLDRHQLQQDRLIERVSVLGPTPAGLRLLSDVTMSADEAYRPASVRRLIATIARAARRVGEEVAFEPSGEALWGKIRDRAAGLMRLLYDAGAFRGAAPGEAYEVRCDRGTMTQNDLDNGRLIVRVQFAPAAPIETITVALIVRNGVPNSALDTEAA